jgi:hypothetical protein
MHHHNATETFLRFFAGLLFLVILFFTGLSYNQAAFSHFMQSFKPAFYFFKYSYPLIKPLYYNWQLTIFSFTLFCWINAWISHPSPMHPEKGFMIGGYPIIPNNQTLIIWLNVISFSLNFLLFFLVKLSSTHSLYWFVFSLFFLSVFASFVLPIVLQKTFVIDQSSKPGQLAKRIKQNTYKWIQKYTLWWKTEAGYCLLQNPFRGVLIIGGPGAGKSYTLIEPIISQTLEKNWAALIYDFKFPVLSTYTWNVYKNLPDKEKPSIYTIYFKDVRYSHRCNPLDPRIMEEMTFANEASKTILYNININWAQKSGDFWSDSAVTILTAMIWWLRCMSVDKKIDVCSLPHAVELCCFDDSSKVIDLLMEHPDVSIAISALKSAHRAGAGEQLAGQMGSLQIAMSKLADKKMFWVMTGNDFTLDLNSPNDPKILLLGNDDMLKKAFAPALSLYASTVAGLINQKGRRECAFIVDECPTLFIQNLENLPNTGRSNKISTILGMQDKAQLNLNYGDKAAKVLQAGFGTIFVGQTSDAETAKLATDIIGKEKSTRKNVSTGQDVSVSFNENLEYVVQQHEMALLNMGEFIGKTSDPMTQDINSEKRFLGKFLVHKPNWHNNPEPMPKILAFPELPESEELIKIDALLTANQTKIKNDIKSLVNREYWKLKISRFLTTGDETIRMFYLKLSEEGVLNTTLDSYAMEAEKVYDAFLNNPAISGDLNNKTLSAITEKILSDILSHSSPSMTKQELSENVQPSLQDHYIIDSLEDEY